MHILSSILSYSILLFVFSFITVCSKPVYKFERFKHNRELATLKEKFPASSIQILRELNRNIKKTQAGVRLVISMEKELKRTARNMGRLNFEPLKRTVVKKNDEYRNLPFSSWAG
eukprot:GFUD01013546.1.p1 GENE.GFUD01013546.1~~GFUD01013546.1.p1  ORF type:complete len:115 (+),score=13.87 GFUD01013546.1:23-367(+)